MEKNEPCLAEAVVAIRVWWARSVPVKYLRNQKALSLMLLSGAAVMVPVLSLASSSSQSKATKVLSLPRGEYTLANGFRVLVVKYPSPGVVAYQIPVKVGSRDEVDEGRTGFAHFFEHLMFRGTKKRHSSVFSRIYNDLGCENNAWTAADMTNYHGMVSKKYLGQILEVEADRFQNLSFDEGQFRDEAGAVLGEYNKNAANPEEAIDEKIAEVAFQKHTYGHTTMGYKRDILKYPTYYKDVWPFFYRHYRPDRTSLVLVGDVTPAEGLALAKRYFGSWIPKTVVPSPKFIVAEPEQTEERVAEITWPQQTPTRLVWSYKRGAFDPLSVDSNALSLIEELYFSSISELYRNLRYEKGWVEDLTVRSGESVDPGLFQVWVRFSAEGMNHEGEILKIMNTTFENLGKEAPSGEKLDRAKDRLVSQWRTRWFMSPSGLAGSIAWVSRFSTKGLSVFDGWTEALLAVSPQQVRDVAEKVFQKSKRTQVILRGQNP